MTPRVTLARFGLVAGLSLATACGVLVPAEVPSFSCVPHVAGACGAGQYCSSGGECVACAGEELVCDGLDEDCDGTADDSAPCDVGTCADGRCIEPFDGGTLHDASSEADAPSCSPTTCPPPAVCDPATSRCIAKGSVAEGGRCIADAVCATGVCAATGAVPASWVANGSYCTKPCCTSADCAAGSVCAAAGTGARYCVMASVLGIAAVGSGPVGSSCSGPAACRSGRCERGFCTDVCCTDASCGAGQTCTLAAATTGAASTLAFHCAPTTGAAGATRACADDADCASAICRLVSTGVLEPRLCMAPCCSSASCGTARGLFSRYDLRCSYERPEGRAAVVGSCREGANAAGKRIGDACVVDGDCYSNQCDPRIGKCTDVCCTNADCEREARGWRCVPLSTVSPIASRCQPPS